MSLEQNRLNFDFLYQCKIGCTDLAKEYLEKGAEIECRNKYGYTALNLACLNGNFNTVKLLLEKGSNIETISRDHTTPLLSACRYNNLDVVKLLIDHGANFYFLDDSGQDFLFHLDECFREEMREYMNFFIADIKPARREK